MCIGSNSVNQAQDLISVTKFEDFPNSLLPTVQCKSVRGGCEAQARKGKGGPLRRKALKLKPLPRAYTNVGRPPPPPRSLISLN